jgi:hypothetical protein
MYLQRQNYISESEIRRIKNLYRTEISSDVAIVDWVSPDEKYIIFLDELYDIDNKIKLGNVFENFDNFKFFLRHSFEVGQNIPKQLKESFLSELDSFVITESNRNYVHLKPYVKEFLLEFDVLGWAKKQGKDFLKTGGELVSKSISGAKKLYKNISDGEWSNVLSLIGKGALFVARKIRELLYNPVGLVLDAILIATGLGKGFQVGIWAIVVLLDVYEFISGDFEDKETALGWRLLFFLCDIMGLVTAGAAAKSSKSLIGGIMNKFGKSEKAIQTAVKTTPELQTLVKSGLNSVSKAEQMVQGAMPTLQQKAPKIAEWLKKPLSGLGNILKKLVEYLGKLLGAPGKAIEKIAGTGLKNTKLVQGSAAAANQLVPLVGIEAYAEYARAAKEDEIATELAKSTITPEYPIDQI